MAGTPALSCVEHACDVATKHLQANLLDEARHLLIRALELQPDHTRAIFLLASVALKSNDLDLAADLAGQGISFNPYVPLLHVLRGNILQRRNQLDESAESFLKALAMEPDSADALYNLGNTRQMQFRLTEAKRCFEKAVQANPRHIEAYCNLGNVLRSLGQLRDAVECYQKALAVDPNAVLAFSNLAIAWNRLGHIDKALDAARRASDLCPGSAELRVNLGSLYLAEDQLEEARKQFQIASQLDPSLPEARANLAATLVAEGRVEEGIDEYRRVLETSRNKADAHSALLFQLHYDTRLTPARITEEHCAWALRHVPSPPPRQSRKPRNRSRLRIGYVSADFRRHSVGYFILPVMEAHDPSTVEVFCYSGVGRPDDMTERFRRCSSWRSTLGLTDEQLAAAIREDDIDILIDLAGHTAGGRPGVFARKPAPVQVTWIGYPNTTGIQAIDYRITDAWADPPGRSEHLHTEKLLRLDGGFSCYGPDPAAPSPAVPHGPVTFGCFNALPKVNDRTLHVWERILDTVAGSQLYLKTKTLGGSLARQHFTTRLLNAGIDPARVRLEGKRKEHAHHLAAYHEVDVALDTFPYNGTTTTYEALWMGVPVVALEGDSHVSRVGVSILSRIGRAGWIGRTEDEYVEIAVRLAREGRPANRERLLPPETIDARSFTRNLEACLAKLLEPRKEEQPVTVSIPGPRPIDASELRRKVEEKPYWYHKIELPGGVTTPGWAPLSRDSYRIPENLTGKRVLDIGAWDGYWSFLALQRGASQVVAVDDFSDYLGSLKDSDRRAWENFDLCRDAFGYTEERCQRREMSVYDITEDKLGRFDIVFFFGTLYHLRHPLLALDRLSAVCNEKIYVESAILDDFSPYRGGFGGGYANQMVMEFYPDKQYGNNDSNWWTPSLVCLGHMVRAAGFDYVEGWKLADKPPSLPACRGFVKGTKRRV